jgi:hypothetical protein
MQSANVKTTKTPVFFPGRSNILSHISNICFQPLEVHVDSRSVVSVLLPGLATICLLRSTVYCVLLLFYLHNSDTIKLDLYLRRELVKCYIWFMALYGVETVALPEQIRNFLRFLKCDTGEGWRR